MGKIPFFAEEFYSSIYIYIYIYIYIFLLIILPTNTLTLGGNLTGIMLYYIINISSSFYSCGWLLTFEGLYLKQLETSNKVQLSVGFVQHVWIPSPSSVG